MTNLYPAHGILRLVDHSPSPKMVKQIKKRKDGEGKI
jgi:hypothetical protein